jgi:hypothetical protein
MLHFHNTRFPFILPNALQHGAHLGQLNTIGRFIHALSVRVLSRSAAETSFFCWVAKCACAFAVAVLVDSLSETRRPM